jgi:hypothetical protein
LHDDKIPCIVKRHLVFALQQVSFSSLDKRLE